MEQKSLHSYQISFIEAVEFGGQEQNSGVSPERFESWFSHYKFGEFRQII